MSCTGSSPSGLLPPILYKPTAFRLLGTTGGLSFQNIALAGCRPPSLPQAMFLPRHYYTVPWHLDVSGSIQGCLNISKHISSPPALSQAALLPRRYYAAPCRGEILSSTQRCLHNRQPCALPKRPLLSRCFHTVTQLSENLGSIRKFFYRGIAPGVFLPRRYFSTPWERQVSRPIRGLFFVQFNRVLRQSWQYHLASTRSVIHFTRNYFGCFWKVTLAAALINIMWSYVYHTHIVLIPYTSHTRFFHFETVPFSNRTHFVVRSPQDDHKYGESCFASIKNKHSSKFLSPLHPDSVRVNRITAKLVPAVQRALAIKSRDVALVHGSPCEDASLDAVHAVESKKHGKSCRSQPQITHLDGLKWEAFVLKEDGLVGAMSLSNGKILVFTGLLNNLETDAEIATIIAHEIAHVVARHWSESIIYDKWFPYPLKVYFKRRKELEADHIGMLLLAAAGFDPHIAPVAVEKLVGNDIFHPSGKKRAQLLSRARCMDEAMELYREVMSAKAP